MQLFVHTTLGSVDLTHGEQRSGSCRRKGSNQGVNISLYLALYSEPVHARSSKYLLFFH